MANTFLQAEWRKLIMANYAIDKEILEEFVPAKTELDLKDGICYVSLVGFMFKNTKLKGFKIPFHVNFEEVNLRFYVKHYDDNSWKRGVVFIKEIVPKPALTAVANLVYKEHYETMAMKHVWENNNDLLEVEYSWKKKNWHSLKVIADSSLIPIAVGSDEEFIAEHYWGYSKVSNKKTVEYEVTHPKWEVYKIKEYFIHVDFGEVYGSEFQFLNNQKPKSIFLAEGSEISVKNKRTI